MAVAPLSRTTGEYGWRFESGSEASVSERNERGSNPSPTDFPHFARSVADVPLAMLAGLPLVFANASDRRGAAPRPVPPSHMNNNYKSIGAVAARMSTQGSTSAALHRCECGETFDSTADLLAHARDVHRFTPW
jgi:hypothetical protein